LRLSLAVEDGFAARVDFAIWAFSFGRSEGVRLVEAGVFLADFLLEVEFFMRSSKALSIWVSVCAGETPF